MERNFLKTWMPTKQLNNKRLIKVDSIWELASLDIEFKESRDQAGLINAASIEYDIKLGSTTEIYPIKGDIWLHEDWDKLPPGHKIFIRAYDSNGDMVDEDSIETIKAPIG